MNTRDIDKAVAETVYHVCTNPLAIVSETDIHMLLAHRLMQIKSLSPTDLYATNCTIGRHDSHSISQAKYKTGLLHKEYGISGMPNSRIDIVVLNRNEVSDIDQPLSLKYKKKWLRPEYAFELGTEKSAGSDVVLKKHLTNDLKKLSFSRIRGYLIHIHRNYCQTTGVRLGKNRIKIQEYEKIIKQTIKSIKPDQKQKIRLIVAIIDIGSMGRRIGREGKVKLFLSGKFTGINQKELLIKIKKILK
jgi:hypothetical protein